MAEWFEQLSADTMLLIESIDPLLSYTLLAVASYIENVFPPAPGDAITVFGASITASGHLSFHGVLISTTIGSVLGFMTFYFLGRKLGLEFFEKKKISFFSDELMEKTDHWFSTYGYGIVICNRFLSGLRSVISIFCGISRLNAGKVLLYSTISALIWNTILVYLGSILGKNWHVVKDYLADYGKIIILAMILFALWHLLRKWKKTKNNAIQEKN